MVVKLLNKLIKIYNKIYFKYLLSLLWTGVILILSLAKMPIKEEGAFNIPNLDKLVHFSMYFIYTILLLFELRHIKLKNLVYYTMFYTTMFGILMEILQQTVFTYRDGSFFDFLANTIGVVAAYLVYRKMSKLIKT